MHHHSDSHKVKCGNVQDLGKILTRILKLGDQKTADAYVTAMAGLPLKTLKLLDLTAYGADVCLIMVRTKSGHLR